MAEPYITERRGVQVVSLNGHKARVYRCKNGRYINFKVRWKSDGEWHTKTFSDKDEAIRKATEIVLSGESDSLDAEIFNLCNDLREKVRLLEALLKSAKELINQVERNQEP